MFAAVIVHIFVFPWDDYKILETKGYDLIRSPGRTQADLQALRMCKLPRQLARRLTVVDFRDICLLAYGVHYYSEEEEPTSDEEVDSTPGSAGDLKIHYEKSLMVNISNSCATEA